MVRRLIRHAIGRILGLNALHAEVKNLRNQVEILEACVGRAERLLLRMVGDLHGVNDEILRRGTPQSPGGPN